MNKYSPLLDNVAITDDETEALDLASNRAELAFCNKVTVIRIVAFFVFLLIVSKLFLYQTSTPPKEISTNTDSSEEIETLLEMNDNGDFNFTENTEYSEKVRENIKKSIKNKINSEQRAQPIHSGLLYQSKNKPIRPFVSMYNKYQIERRYNLSSCMTPKAMATTLHGIFCYLHNTEKFEKLNKSLTTVYWDDPECSHHVLPRVQSTARLTDFVPAEHNSFQVVREPIKRFISAFINKCIDELRKYPPRSNWKYCYDCKGDIECVVTKAHHDIMKRSRYDRIFHGPQDNQYFSEHVYPLTWQCDIAMRYNSIHFIRYVSGGKYKADMVNQLLSVMQMSGVENYKLKKISRVLLDDKPLTHATKGSNLPHKFLNKIYNSPKMLNLLISLYYYDYLVFEYPFPKLGEISEFD